MTPDHEPWQIERESGTGWWFVGPLWSTVRLRASSWDSAFMLVPVTERMAAQFLWLASSGPTDTRGTLDYGVGHG